MNLKFARMKILKSIMQLVSLVTIVIGSAFTITAQDAIGPFISTVGTTVREAGNGRDWAYLLWTANTPTLVAGRSYAIYAKAGDANAAGAFTRVSIVSLQTEAITLAPVLGRAALLGEDTNSLHIDFDALFGDLAAANLTLPEKLSTVVRGALEDPKHFGRLLLLSRTHPSVAMAAGFAHAQLIGPGQTTFEVREFDRAAQTDGAVIGRVTVTAGAPTILPAPGRPVELAYDNARGHLNAQLRWGVPNSLRRLSLLQHGYNVWRVRKDFADARNWGTTPPTPDTLFTLSEGNTAIRRVNKLPLLTRKTFSVAEAENFTPPLGDPKTFFVIDDNDRGRSNIVTTRDFTNGARFYYFVTARDILGRDGAVSAGREVQICNKLPPNALENVEVVNDYTWVGGGDRQRLRVKWPQASNNQDAEQQIRTYWVYRWSSVAEMRAKQGDPMNNRIAVVNHTPGRALNSYLDDGSGAPTSPAANGKTIWYTVRAEDDGACQGNLSPHSAPAFGVLRDRTGPPAPTGQILAQCFDPAVDFLGRTTNGTTNPGPLDESFQFSAVGIRGDRRIDWMEFVAEVRPVGSTTVVGRYRSSRMHFGSGAAGSFVNFLFDVPGSRDSHELFVNAKAGFGDGETGSTTGYQLIHSSLQKGDRRVNLLFGGKVEPQAKDDPCDRHFTLGPSQTLLPMEIVIEPKIGSKEVRVYRRVDDGPLDLIYQRPLNSLEPFSIQDDTFPHGGAKVCYFASTLDEHGNASPLTSLGCKLALESSEPPQPQLSPISSLGADNAPQMVLSWFCPSANVDRFEVTIAALGEPISENCAPGFLEAIPPPNVPEVQMVSAAMAASAGFPALDLALEIRRFHTPRPSADFGNNERFTIPVDVQLGRRYIVSVKSIGRSGALSDRSNGESFFWQETVPPQPDVPWPPRPLPPVGNSFGFNFEASFTPMCGSTNLPGIPVIQIGDQGYSSRGVECPQRLSLQAFPGVDPNSLLPTNNIGESLFPVALFRQQEANSDFPNVSGDLVQVTPMMEAIAWGLDGNETVIYDPYILIEDGIYSGPPRHGIFLRDTQPVISGSRYKYFLVRFNALGELAEVIPAANELEVP